MVAIVDADPRPTEHAYGSVSMLLLASLTIVIAVAVAGSLLTQIRLLAGAPVAWLESARHATSVMWWLAHVVAAVVVATVLLIPVVAPR